MFISDSEMAWQLGHQQNCRCELVFQNCFVPEENVLGQEGKGTIDIINLSLWIDPLHPLLLFLRKKVEKIYKEISGEGRKAVQGNN